MHPDPAQSPGAAAKTLARDVSALVQAEVALAKAEVLGGVKAKTTGAGLLAAAGAVVGVAVLALLVAAGFALAEVGGLPGWASALIVAGGLLALALVLGLAGRAKLTTQVSAEVTKDNVDKDVKWVKNRSTAPRR